MQKNSSTVVILGTGGTIAGVAAQAQDAVGYTAAQLGLEQLVAQVPGLADAPLELQQLAQLDSKDMSFAVWRELAHTVSTQLVRPEVCGVVITHGTDTLEETAYFLQRVLAPSKPVVLVAAMRPATSLQADGPQNLADAVTVARTPQASGVTVVLAGRVHSALEVQKIHTHALDAFDSGDLGVVGHVFNGEWRPAKPWPVSAAHGLHQLPADVTTWPPVEIVTSHAAHSGLIVKALCDLDVRGVVVACTGNGTVHHVLEAALRQAQNAGIAVLRSTRCARGGLWASSSALPCAENLTPVQARIELMLQLLAVQTAT
jgi:L-asparaginase